VTITWTYDPDSLELSATATLSDGKTYGKGVRFTSEPTQEDFEKRKRQIVHAFELRQEILDGGPYPAFGMPSPGGLQFRVKHADGEVRAVYDFPAFEGLTDDQQQAVQDQVVHFVRWVQEFSGDQPGLRLGVQSTCP
jgi:hypothetical protein